MKSGQSSFPANVIQQFPRDIAACWNEVPLLANEAVRVEDPLRLSMEVVLEAVLSNASLVHIVASVEALRKKANGYSLSHVVFYLRDARPLRCLIQ